jgi:hypothetical protein
MHWPLADKHEAVQLRTWPVAQSTTGSVMISYVIGSLNSSCKMKQQQLIVV